MVDKEKDVVIVDEMEYVDVDLKELKKEKKIK